MKDHFGDYQICSGREGLGKCWWCGSEFPDARPRRYCSETCAERYRETFYWAWAVPAALKRAGFQCQEPECECEGNLEVHHMIPLDGAPRVANALNMPDNLIVYCRRHHPKKRLPRHPLQSLFDKEISRGQMVMEELISV